MRRLRYYTSIFKTWLFFIVLKRPVSDDAIYFAQINYKMTELETNMFRKVININKARKYGGKKHLVDFLSSFKEEK